MNKENTAKNFSEIVDGFLEESVDKEKCSGLIYFIENGEITIKSFGSLREIMQSMIISWSGHEGIGMILDDIRKKSSWQLDVLSNMPKITKEKKEQLKKNHWKENSNHKNCGGEIIKFTDIGAGYFLLENEAKDIVICKKCGKIGMRCAGKNCSCNQ